MQTEHDPIPPSGRAELLFPASPTECVNLLAHYYRGEKGRMTSWRDRVDIQRGDLPGRQPCAGAPWVIKADHLAPFEARQRLKKPITSNPAQQALDLQ
jgi:hypothetical protein